MEKTIFIGNFTNLIKTENEEVFDDVDDMPILDLYYSAPGNKI